MLSRKLYFIFTTGAIIIALIVVLFLPRTSNWVSIFIVPFILALALSYVFSPQIDWWWYQKHPPELSGSLGNLLLQHFKFYKNLSVENKKRFRHRTAMYMEARGFYARRGNEDGNVPLDIKTMISANVVMMTFGRKDFILDKFERVFVYLQAFHSPNHKYWHASELNEEDECFLFSGEHIMLSFRQPEKYYNVILHEYARAFQLTYPQFDYPNFDESMWSGFGKEAIAKYTGIPEEEINLLGVSVNFFFNYPEKFKKLMPKGYEQYTSIFNLNPLDARDPVVDKSIVAGIP